MNHDIRGINHHWHSASIRGCSLPAHCGLHAAIAKDDWIDNAATLREITQRDDYIGHWWDVPVEHLKGCTMALTYLDPQGIAFYLPAYMTALIQRPEAFDLPGRSGSWQVIWHMQPRDEDPELAPLFYEQFSLIRGERKDVCLNFLTYVAACDGYHEHARQAASEAISHTFWSGQS